jgi:hypothetical protein
MSCEEGLYTLDDLYKLMKKLNPPEVGGDMYSTKHIKNLLLERYGQHIVFAEIKGRKNVICFRNFCNFIISDAWYNNRSVDSDTEHERIVKSSARLIASQIRDLNVDMNSYPSVSDILSGGKDIIPPLLKLFLQSLIGSVKKQTALAQCIIQAAKPRGVLMPLQFGLGVQMEHLFGSKFLLQHLSSLGFSCSYDEVRRFKKSVLHSSLAPESDVNKQVNQAVGFTQYVADNIDHNVCTLDGSGTFHGMGMISASVLDNGQLLMPQQRILRLSGTVKTAEVCKLARVEIVPYEKSPNAGLRCLQLQAMKSLERKIVSPSPLQWRPPHRFEVYTILNPLMYNTTM